MANNPQENEPTPEVWREYQKALLAKETSISDRIRNARSKGIDIAFEALESGEFQNGKEGKVFIKVFNEALSNTLPILFEDKINSAEQIARANVLIFQKEEKAKEDRVKAAGVITSYREQYGSEYHRQTPSRMPHDTPRNPGHRRPKGKHGNVM